MILNIKMAKNFQTALNKMRDTYGDEMARLNGLSDEQLSLTDFIQNFIDHDTVADASIDGNANVGHKDIVLSVGGHKQVLADVVQINSDDTERQPYTEPY